MGTMSRIAEVPSLKIYSCQATVATALTPALHQLNLMHEVCAGIKHPVINDSPLFKFGFNPSLIDGILNVLPYELAS